MRLRKLKEQNEEKKRLAENSFSQEKSPTSERLKTSSFMPNKKKGNEKKTLTLRENMKLERIKYAKHLKQSRLFECAIKNDLQVLLYSGLYFEKEDVNSYDKNGNVALHYSCSNGNLKFTEFLIAKGADINLKCKNGNTPVHNACKTNNFDVLYYIFLLN